MIALLMFLTFQWPRVSLRIVVSVWSESEPGVVIMIMRVYALYYKNKFILWFLFCILLGQIITTAWGLHFAVGQWSLHLWQKSPCELLRQISYDLAQQLPAGFTGSYLTFGV